MRLALGLPCAAIALLSFSLLAPVAGAASPNAQMAPDVAKMLPDLADQPATHTGVVFDRSMMQIAQSVLQSGGLDSDRAAAALTSISFDTYRFREPAFYTPETMAQLVEAYHRAGWKHLVNGNQRPGNSAQPRSAIMDLWLHFNGGDIDHMTVLVRAAHDMNLIQVAGDLRPLDLVHLSGHFGIPKVDPNAVMVPAPQ